MKKTIKELADELGVSKQAIQKRINNLPTKQQPTKVGGKFVLDETVSDLIRSYYTENEEKHYLNDNYGTNVVDNLLSDVVDSLKADKVELFGAMKAKDIQIEKLQKLLDQQQVLTLQANKKIAELETTLENPQQVKNDETEEQAPKKENFWAKWFR